jgi:hypothetical protein
VGGPGGRRGALRSVPPAISARGGPAEVDDRPVLPGGPHPAEPDHDGHPGALADRATYFRFDLFLADNPTTPTFLNDPHQVLFISVPDRFLPVPLPPEIRAAGDAVVQAAQDQIAVFFASDSARIIDPDGPGALFETPIVPPLPEEVVFFP